MNQKRTKAGIIANVFASANCKDFHLRSNSCEYFLFDEGTGAYPRQSLYTTPIEYRDIGRAAGVMLGTLRRAQKSQ